MVQNVGFCGIWPRVCELKPTEQPSSHMYMNGDHCWWAAGRVRHQVYEFVAMSECDKYSFRLHTSDYTLSSVQLMLTGYFN